MYYRNIELYNDDCLKLLKKIPKKSVDMIFADPPYFLSDNGITCSSGKMESVNKGEWDKSMSIKDIHKFNKKWIALCRNVLKDNGTIFVSGTFHNIYSIGMALLENEFVILNNIIWQKLNPPPNLSCRYFTHSTETIIWAKKTKKAKHTFNYVLMKELNNGKQMKDVFTGGVINKKEKEFGNHPTQKPLYLLERIILAATNEGDTVLDPFAGSGTSIVMSYRLNRKSIGIEKDKEYFKLMQKRIEKELSNEQPK